MRANVGRKSAAMLKSLGNTKLAYDWRDKHIPTFDAELDASNKHRIRLQACWIATGPEPANSKPLQTILDFLKRRRVKTELWIYSHRRRSLPPFAR